MNPKYSKKSGKEIKKSKTEFNFHLNFDKINAEKDLQKINYNHKLSNRENSKNLSQSESNSKISEETNNYNLNENDNYTIKSLDSERTENNKQEESNSRIDDYDINKNIIINNKIKKILLNNHKKDKYCQCCGKKFDEKIHIPLLLKCNHIFCKICLGKYFTDEDSIICPIDGHVGKTYEDLQNLNQCNCNCNCKKISKENNNYDRNKGNIKKGNNPNSIKSLFHKSNSQKELLNYKNNNFIKKRNNKINIYNKMNNFLNDSKNKNNIHCFSLTNRNKELNINLYNKKYLNNNDMKNSESKCNKTSTNIKEGDINKSKIQKIRKTSNKKRNKYRSKSVLNSNRDNNNYYSNSNNTNEDDSGNFCTIHPEQRISHFVEETRELICIHCAFNKLKNDPNIQIKEIPEKCKEYIADLENIIENNKNYIQIINNSIVHINENKQNEEKKIIEIYEELTNLLITNRNNYLIKVEEIYQQNKSIMDKKLDNLEEIIDISEKLKEDFYTLHDKAPNEFNFLAQSFNQFLREINDKNNSEIHIIQYNFSHDETNKIIKYINNFADVKSKKKVFKFELTKTEEESKNNNENNIDINNLINAYSQKNSLKKYFRVYKPLKQVEPKNIFNDYYIKNKSATYNNNNLINYYRDSENVNEILNKYIASTNMIRDSLYSYSNIKNSSLENNTNENNIQKYLKDRERLNQLKKYKFPFKACDN